MIRMHKHKHVHILLLSFLKGDWTDDMDQQIMIVLSLIANKGRPAPADFAARLRQWERHGFPDPPFNDIGEGLGIGNLTALVASHPLFCSKKAEHYGAAALHYWLHPFGGCGRSGSANGGMMRTAILGALPDPTTAALVYSRTTHASPWADASAVAVVKVGSLAQ